MAAAQRRRRRRRRRRLLLASAQILRLVRLRPVVRQQKEKKRGWEWGVVALAEEVHEEKRERPLLSSTSTQ